MSAAALQFASRDADATALGGSRSVGDTDATRRRAAHVDELRARAVLSALVTLEEVLKLPKFAGRVTSLCVVG